MSPLLLVISQIVDADGLASLPIPPDQLPQDDGIALCDIDPPVVQPVGSVCGAGDGGAHLAGKVCTFVDGDSVACATEGEGGAETADATADDGDVEGLPGV